MSGLRSHLRQVAMAVAIVALVATLTSCEITVNGCRLHSWSPETPTAITADCPDANLPGIVLRDITLAVPVWPRANLVGANFSRTTVIGGIWEDANLTGAKLTGGTWAEVEALRVNFTNADLTGATFSAFWAIDSDFTGTLVVPESQTVTATGPTGAVVSWPTPSTMEGNSELGPGECDHPSGSQFAVGETEVRCDVHNVDGSGNFGTFTVTVLPTP